MKIGLIGLPQTGKTTFFNLLTGTGKDTGSSSYAKTGATEGSAKIPDERIDFLTEIYKPKKVTYAALDVIDINGITPENSGSKSSSAYYFLEKARQADALVHVVRAFRDDSVPHIDGSIDPLRDIQTVNIELLFADLAIIENRIQRIETGKKVTKENQQELIVLKKCRECLESEKLINSLELSDEEKVYLRTFNFLTERPLVILVNLDDEQFTKGSYEKKEELLQYADSGKLPVIEVCAKTELEISELDEDDKNLFMEDLGIKETGISRLATAVYDYLQLISFLTVGEDEVRAWTIKKGTQAKAAGGKIHSDIERGFIRAEVVKYKDFKSLGSMQKIKEKGLFRLEGKEAIIEDGDIINFRFNV